MYIANGVKYSVSSPINRAIIKAFLDREIKLNMSDFVEYVLDTGNNNNAPPFRFEDITIPKNDVSCPDCGGNIPDEPILISELGLTPELNENRACDPSEKYTCPVCGVGYPDMDSARDCCDTMEIYQCPHCQYIMTAVEYDELSEGGDMPKEWWAVSEWLLKKLLERGATVLETYNLWGRMDMSSTDPLYRDELIIDICRSIGILDGQEHSWSKFIKVA